MSFEKPYMEEKIVSKQARSEEISFKDVIVGAKGYFTYILSKWYFILTLGLIGGGIGFAYASMKKASYTATSTFVLESGGSSGGGLAQYAGIASMVGVNLGDGGGGIFEGDNLFELYKSRNMLQRALLAEAEFNGKKQLLIERYIEFNHLSDSWKNSPQTNNISFRKNDKQQFTRVQDSIIGVIVADINKNYMAVSKQDKKLSIIKVEVKAMDELFAKAFNDQIVSTVNDFYIQTKIKKSTGNIAILQRQTDSVKNVLNGAIYASASVNDATPNLNPTRLVLRAPAQRSQFNAEANKAILSQLVQNLELAKLTLLNETPLIQMVDGPVFPLYKDKLAKSKGVIFGGIFGGFLAIVVLIFRRFFSSLFED